MNRLLLTAAAALTMGVASHATAATYTLDSFEGVTSLAGSLDPMDNGVAIDGVGSSSAAGSIASYSSSGFTFGRSVLFEQTEGTANDSTSLLFITGVDQEEAPLHYAMAYIQNYNAVNSKLTLTYDIGSLDAAVGNGLAAFTISMINSDASEANPLHVDAILNGNLVETWNLTTPTVFFEQPATNHTFNVLGSSLSGAGDQLSFVVRGSAGYNAVFAPITFDVLPVPELGLLPMFGSGLLVVGFAARRKRAVSSL